MNKYVRTDENAIIRVLKDSLNVRLWAVSMTVIVIVTLVTLMIEISKPKLLAVIDSSTGQTFHGVTQQRLTYSIIEKLVMRSSLVFCEAFYSYSTFTVTEDRKKAASMMNKQAFEKLPANWLDNDDVKTCKKLGATANFDWILKPTVTYAKDPNYISFCQFSRDVSISGMPRNSHKINVKLYWQRIDNYDYLQTENGLVLVGFEELNDDSKELKDEITKINKGGIQ